MVSSPKRVLGSAELPLSVDRARRVLQHLRWCLSVEWLMWSLCIVVVYELFKSLSDTRPTAHPRVMEAINSHLESMKSLFDQVSLDVVELTAQF